MLKQIISRLLTVVYVFSFVSIAVMPQELLAHNAEDDLLTTLSISFNGFHFDEEDGFILNGDFNILEKEGAYYGVSNLNLFCGTKKIGKWEKALTRVDVSLLNKFIKALEKTANKIDVAGYNNDYYSVDYAGEHWDIKPDKHIFGNTKGREFYPNLEFYTTIFIDELEQPRLQRKKHVESVNEFIFKKWYYNPNGFRSLKRGSVLVFSSEPIGNATAYWEIDENNKLNEKSETIKLDSLDISLQYHAEASVTEYMYLAVYENRLINRIDNDERALKSHSFYVKKLTKDVMVLEIAF